MPLCDDADVTGRELSWPVRPEAIASLFVPSVQHTSPNNFISHIIQIGLGEKASLEGAWGWRVDGVSDPHCTSGMINPTCPVYKIP